MATSLAYSLVIMHLIGSKITGEILPGLQQPHIPPSP